MQSVLIQLGELDLQQVIEDSVRKVLSEQPAPEPQPTAEDELLTQAETARLLHTSKQSVINFSKRGILHPLYFGKSVRYRKSEVLRLNGGAR